MCSIVLDWSLFLWHKISLLIYSMRDIGLNKQNETRFDNRSCYSIERNDYYYDR